MSKAQNTEVRYYLEDVLALGLAIAKRSGFVSVKQAETSGVFTTGTEVAMIISSSPDSLKIPEVEVQDCMPVVMSVVDFVESMEVPKGPFLDYVMDLKLWFYKGEVPLKKVKLVVSVLGAFFKAQEEKLLPKVEKVSKWLGIEDEKISVTATVTTKRPLNTRFGMSQVVNAVTADGGTIVWFASGNISHITVGKQYKVEGKVKNLTEFKGTKQTIMSRPKFTKI